MNRLSRALASLVAAVSATVAGAQVSLPGAPLPRLPAVTDPVTGALKPAGAALADLRKLRVRELLRVEGESFEAGPGGQPSGSRAARRPTGRPGAGYSCVEYEWCTTYYQAAWTQGGGAAAARATTARMRAP